MTTLNATEVHNEQVRAALKTRTEQAIKMVQAHLTSEGKKVEVKSPDSENRWRRTLLMVQTEIGEVPVEVFAACGRDSMFSHSKMSREQIVKVEVGTGGQDFKRRYTVRSDGRVNWEKMFDSIDSMLGLYVACKKRRQADNAKYENERRDERGWRLVADAIRSEFPAAASPVSASPFGVSVQFNNIDAVQVTALLEFAKANGISQKEVK